MVGQTVLKQQHSALCGYALPTSGHARTLPSRRCAVTVKAEQDQALDRRAALSLLAGAATLISAQPSKAAFGEGANIFGQTTNTSGLIPFQGDGFTLDVPSRWVPSKEREVPNVVFRYEDTQDTLNNILIFKVKGKGGDLSDASNFLKSNAYLFGENVWKGNTISEGGFKKNQVSQANLIDSYDETKNGKKYLKMEVLTRTADNTEGGRHNLIAATNAGGDLWVCKVQIGDKRWFRGAGKSGRTLFNSFAVA